MRNLQETRRATRYSLRSMGDVDPRAYINVGLAPRMPGIHAEGPGTMAGAGKDQKPATMTWQQAVNSLKTMKPGESSVITISGGLELIDLTLFIVEINDPSKGQRIVYEQQGSLFKFTCEKLG